MVGWRDGWRDGWRSLDGGTGEGMDLRLVDN